MSKPIVMTPSQWHVVFDYIKQREKPSTYLSRTKMKEVLGFTVRTHREHVPKMDGGYYDESIRLDFYDEQKRTMFLLKYGNGQD